MLLLKATEANWNRLSPGSWEKTKWKINDNGAYSISLNFTNGIQSASYTGRLTLETLEKLKSVLAVPWNTEDKAETDGNPWEFKVYRYGAVSKYRDLSYIRGVEALEAIVALLPRDYDEEMVEDELEIE